MIVEARGRADVGGTSVIGVSVGGCNCTNLLLHSSLNADILDPPLDDLCGDWVMLMLVEMIEHVVQFLQVPITGLEAVGISEPIK